jgi:hypothetical protein
MAYFCRNGEISGEKNVDQRINGWRVIGRGSARIRGWCCSRSNGFARAETAEGMQALLLIMQWVMSVGPTESRCGNGSRRPIVPIGLLDLKNVNLQYFDLKLAF